MTTTDVEAINLSAQVLAVLKDISGFIWGPYLLIPLLLGTGLFLTVGLRFAPILNIGRGFSLLFQSRQGTGKGEITPFQALATALSATIGTGNIGGVALAIAIGGPGAIFWMWMTALVGMATKYSEAVLAVKYREVDDNGRYVGGPMYYVRNGLGPRWAWLGATFAFFAMIAGFGIGNMTQSNAIAGVLDQGLSIPTWASGLVLAALTFTVIIGGVKRIAAVAERLVPLMALFYIAAASVILVLNAEYIPGAFGLIFSDAFTGSAAAGGFAGSAFILALQTGVARGIFSNESGLGSAPIAHAAAQTDDPVRQGTIAMMGTFIDTLIVCTMTALVILTVQVPVDGGEAQTIAVWLTGESSDGAKLTATAFGSALPGGQWVVTIGLLFFAFTTILGWSYYGERAAEYLFGVGVILPYRVLWVLAVMAGATLQLDIVWKFADIMNGLMALPNLIALLALSGTIFAISRASR